MKALFARLHRWIGERFGFDDVHYRLDPRVRVLEEKVARYAALLHICQAELRLVAESARDMQGEDAPPNLVHNHGTEEGPGLACKETLVAGRLVGDCIRRTLRPKLVRSAPEARAEGTTRAGRDADHNDGTPDSRGESETAVAVGLPKERRP